jgi:hypothetical protein
MISASLRLRLELSEALAGSPHGLGARVVLAIHQEPGAQAISGFGQVFPRAGLSLDILALAKSGSAPGSYYILTCGCAFHECARVNESIDVRHTGSSIVWHIPGGDAGYHVDATILAFCRTAYRDEIARLVALLHTTRPASILCFHTSFESVLASIKSAIDGGAVGTPR